MDRWFLKTTRGRIYSQPDQKDQSESEGRINMDLKEAMCQRHMVRNYFIMAGLTLYAQTLGLNTW